jgi:hypothetical protein
MTLEGMPNMPNVPPNWEEITALIQATGVYCWPLVAVVALILFRPQLGGLLKRVKSGKIFGQEVVLGDTLDDLDQKAKQAETTVADLPQPKSKSVEQQGKIDAAQQETDDIVRNIIDEASRSPKAALLTLSAEIEKEMRRLLGSMGQLDKSRLGVPRAIGQLSEWGWVPRNLIDAVQLFWEVRNRIVHGYDAEPDDVLRAIDSGLTILKTLRATLRQTVVVNHPGVDLYADKEGRRKVDGVKGIILDIERPSGSTTERFVYPTTVTTYKRDQRLTWETGKRVFGEMWYRDPDTNEIKANWTSAAEFVGRPLDEV